ncbi:hypothetical protein HD806DRAFT_551106 [Xylariaceae sp. AK1471]|nr:hypothetical protein HD806DRAFT_551106 [Xylariaceae sp. AK1471]
MKYAQASQVESPTFDSPQDSQGLPAPTAGAPGDVRIRGTTRQICIAFLMITVPMTAFVALLLGFVYHYRVNGGDAMSPNLGTGTRGEAGAIYVNFSATTLTTVASWSSTVAPLLLTFVISLSSFPAARKLLDATQSPEGSDTLIFVTDTWLHFTTETVAFTKISPLTTIPNASFDLNNNTAQQCYNVSYTEYGVMTASMTLDDPLQACTLNIAAANTFLSGNLSIPLLSNSSIDGEVKTYIDRNGTNFAYLGIPARTDLYNVDFSAHTWALSSSCTPITKDCITRITGPDALYNRSSIAFNGDLATNSINHMTMQYFSGAAMTDPAPGNVSVSNPYYYAAIASVNQNTGYNRNLVNDSGIAIGLHSATIIAVACNTTVWDIEYTSINGSITRFVTSPSNRSMANIMMGTQSFTHVADAFLTQSFSTGAWLANSAQDIADNFAREYSLAALSLGGGAMTPSLAMEAQFRTEILVARVPLAPLYALVASNLLLLILGLVLTVWAIGTARGDVSEVQARLGVVGLRPVRHVEDIFGEKSGLGARKVGIFKTPLGGWVLGVGG